MFGKNRKAISFWLQNCVFPQDLLQYPQTLSASAEDLADATTSIGFSGTKDNKEISSSKIKYDPLQDDNIRGTDGQMINIMVHFATKFERIEEDPIEKTEVMD